MRFSAFRAIENALKHVEGSANQKIRPHGRPRSTAHPRCLPYPQRSDKRRNSLSGVNRRRVNYRIRVKGHLDSSWQHWFAGLQIEHEVMGTTILSGYLPDQAALFGLLLKIQRLGLTLL